MTDTGEGVESTDDSTRGPGRRSKVERVIGEYDLEGLGAELEELWTRDTDRYSLRDLAAYFNQAVLRTTMEEAGMQVLEGDVENRYRLLTDDDVSMGTRREAERSLEREGIDVEALENDFVSHRAVHTYLTKYRDARPGNEPADPAERVRKGSQTIERLRSRLVAVAESVLGTLQKTGQLPVEEFDVIVDVRVVDRETGEAYAVGDLLHGDEEDAGE